MSEIYKHMDNYKISRQIHAIFDVFFVLFYLGTAVFLFFFSNNFTIDPALKMIVGVSFALYGSYRAVKSFHDIKKLFSGKEDDEDTDYNY